MAKETYEISIVAFIDILGFKKHFGDKKQREALLELLSEFSRENGEFFHNKSDSDKVESIRPAVTAFSDNIILSCLVKTNDYQDFHKKLSTILKGISYFSGLALSKNYIFRGALSVGDFYHKNGTVIGEPLIDCVEHEKIANYPRIILTSTFLEQFECYQKTSSYSTKEMKKMYCFEEDFDGIVYFNYLSYFNTNLSPDTLVYSLPENLDYLEKQISIEKNLKVVQKLKWAYKYFDRFNKKSGCDLLIGAENIGSDKIPDNFSGYLLVSESDKIKLYYYKDRFSEREEVSGKSGSESNFEKLLEKLYENFKRPDFLKTRLTREELNKITILSGCAKHIY